MFDNFLRERAIDRQLLLIRGKGLATRDSFGDKIARLGMKNWGPYLEVKG